MPIENERERNADKLDSRMTDHPDVDRSIGDSHAHHVMCKIWRSRGRELSQIDGQVCEGSTEIKKQLMYTRSKASIDKLIYWWDARQDSLEDTRKRKRNTEFLSEQRISWTRYRSVSPKFGERSFTWLRSTKSTIDSERTWIWQRHMTCREVHSKLIFTMTRLKYLKSDDYQWFHVMIELIFIEWVWHEIVKVNCMRIKFQTSSELCKISMDFEIDTTNHITIFIVKWSVHMIKWFRIFLFFYQIQESYMIEKQWWYQDFISFFQKQELTESIIIFIFNSSI